MLEQLFTLFERIETGIGNRARLSVIRYGTGLQFRVNWPDNFRLCHVVDELEITTIEEDIWIEYFIKKAKEAHPVLATDIS